MILPDFTEIDTWYVPYVVRTAAPLNVPLGAAGVVALVVVVGDFVGVVVDFAAVVVDFAAAVVAFVLLDVPDFSAAHDVVAVGEGVAAADGAAEGVDAVGGTLAETSTGALAESALAESVRDVPIASAALEARLSVGLRKPVPTAHPVASRDADAPTTAVAREVFMDSWCQGEPEKTLRERAAAAADHATGPGGG